jgi:hypothetical protein
MEEWGDEQNCPFPSKMSGKSFNQLNHSSEISLGLRNLKIFWLDKIERDMPFF